MRRLRWWRGRIAEALRTLVTQKGPSAVSERFQWSQRFSGRAQIDALVYELYGLTEEEIEGWRVVEVVTSRWHKEARMEASSMEREFTVIIE